MTSARGGYATIIAMTLVAIVATLTTMVAMSSATARQSGRLRQEQVSLRVAGESAIVRALISIRDDKSLGDRRLEFDIEPMPGRDRKSVV